MLPLLLFVVVVVVVVVAACSVFAGSCVGFAFVVTFGPLFFVFNPSTQRDITSLSPCHWIPISIPTQPGTWWRRIIFLIHSCWWWCIAFVVPPLHWSYCGCVLVSFQLYVIRIVKWISLPVTCHCWKITAYFAWELMMWVNWVFWRINGDSQ